jgi:hypothetical protein
MDMGNSPGRMEAATKATFGKMTLKRLGFTGGQMQESTSVIGKTIKCTEKACSSGQMVGNMTAAINSTRKNSTESSHGLMDASTLDTGKQDNSTV